ncbi:hypothetical protein HG530_011179 [Fusarium avenaceum]|nr:hypothetical protein HG530_011179 [Fusarium avenaceum]
MDINGNGDKPRPAAPSEPISPAPSSSAVPKTSTSRVASPIRAPTPDSVRAIVVKSPVPESAPDNAPNGVSLTSAPQVTSTPKMQRSPLPSISASAPVAKERVPSPATVTATPTSPMPSASSFKRKSPVLPTASSARSPSPRQVVISVLIVYLSLCHLLGSWPSFLISSQHHVAFNCFAMMSFAFPAS